MSTGYFSSCSSDSISTPPFLPLAICGGATVVAHCGIPTESMEEREEEMWDKKELKERMKGEKGEIP